jgi:hypothetical protein
MRDLDSIEISSISRQESGAVTAAGWNSEGQLGVGRNTESSSLPMAVPGMG